MGLYDRDYMKARPDRDGNGDDPSRKPFPPIAVLIVAIAVILGVVIALLSMF